MSEPIAPEVQKAINLYEERGITYDFGYVYLVKAENGLYKIGKSKNVAQRFKSLKTASPVKLELFLTFQTSDMTQAEEMLHFIFSEFREIGEWFRLGKEEILEILDREGDHVLSRCYI